MSRGVRPDCGPGYWHRPALHIFEKHWLPLAQAAPCSERHTAEHPEPGFWSQQTRAVSEPLAEQSWPPIWQQFVPVESQQLVP